MFFDRPVIYHVFFLLAAPLPRRAAALSAPAGIAAPAKPAGTVVARTAAGGALGGRPSGRSGPVVDAPPGAGRGGGAGHHAAARAGGRLWPLRGVPGAGPA